MSSILHKLEIVLATSKFTQGSTSDQKLAVKKISGKNSKAWMHETYSKTAHARIKMNLHRLNHNTFESQVFTEESTYDSKHTLNLSEFF